MSRRSDDRIKTQRQKPRVHLNRALSKLGILTRSQATEAILAGRVSVDGRVIRDPARAIDPAAARITVDDAPRRAVEWRTVLLHKPRGVVTTRRDPEGRPTVYDVLAARGEGLVPIGRLDLATSGLLLLTTDTALASWIENPDNAVPRTYLVTVRGLVTEREIKAMCDGIVDSGDRLSAASVVVRKGSNRESHLTMTLVEGKNREIRRLCAVLGHEVTRLKRVQLGGLTLGRLGPGDARELDPDDIHRAFPDAPIASRISENRSAVLRHPGRAV